MKKVEYIAYTVLAISILLKLLHIPGGNMLLIMTLSTLSFIYAFGFNQAMPNSPFKNIFGDNSYENLKGFQVAIAAIANILLAIQIIGILFFIMFWPGGETFLLVGFGGGLIIFLALVLAFQRSQQPALMRRLIRLGGWTAVATICYFMPVETRAELLPCDKPCKEAFIESQKNPSKENRKKFQDELYQSRQRQNGRSPNVNPQEE